MHNYVVEALKKPTARDKQKTIGPSTYASPCTRCVANALAEVREQRNDYWLGAVIGTAIHELVERRAPEGVATEQRVELGYLTDYGLVDGSADVVFEEGVVGDIKTTDRAKLKGIKEAFNTEPHPLDLTSVQEARFKVQTYIGQLSQYAMGLNNAGHDIHTLAFTFVCRDGKTDSDIWSVDIAYDESYALRVWNRLEKLWDYIRDGGSPQDLESHTLCWPCNYG